MFGVQLIKQFDSYTGDEDGKWTFGGRDNSVIRGSRVTAPLIQHVWWEITVPTIKVGAAKTTSSSSSVIMSTTLIVLSKTDSDQHLCSTSRRAIKLLATVYTHFGVM